MTTSIRNITRRQDKEMLTSSSRLLHAKLEEFQGQMEERRLRMEGKIPEFQGGAPQVNEGASQASSTIEVI
jgi:hypothetical protein